MRLSDRVKERQHLKIVFIWQAQLNWSQDRPYACIHLSVKIFIRIHISLSLSAERVSPLIYSLFLSINLITSSAISHWPPPHLYFSFLSLLLYHLTISFCVTKTLCSSHCLLFSPLLSVWSCMWVQPWCLGLSVSWQPFNIRNCSQDAEAWHFIFPSTFLFLSVRHSLTHTSLPSSFNEDIP